MHAPKLNVVPFKLPGSTDRGNEMASIFTLIDAYSAGCVPRRI